MRWLASIYQHKRFLILEHWNLYHIILPHLHFVNLLLLLSLYVLVMSAQLKRVCLYEEVKEMAEIQWTSVKVQEE